ncbi:MAG: hypothetical protein ACXWKP_00425 [Bradyrhizobium sp.]
MSGDAPEKCWVRLGDLAGASAHFTAVLEQLTGLSLVLGRFFGVEFIMQTTSRTPSSVARDGNVVPLQRKDPAAAGSNKGYFPGSVQNMADLPALMERASNAARQMRYFRLAAKKSFSELLLSAKRAGFTSLYEDTQRKEATFQWSVGAPDFIFSVSLRDAARASIVAESRADIFGLILIGYSHAPSISVETNPSLGNKELGRNALLFRDMMLTFPDFDGMPAWTKYW